MTTRTAGRLARGAWILSLALGVVGIGLQALAGLEWNVFVPISIVMLLGFSTMGLLIASRQPGNSIGWIFVAIGLAWALSSLAEDYAFYARAKGHTSSPLARIADWSGQWSWMPIVFLAPMLLALLFPTGRPLSSRWRVTVWVAVGSMSLLVLATAFAPGALTDAAFLEENPFALAVSQGAIDLAFLIGALGVFTSVGASLASLFIRFRRSRGDERQQMKWLLFALGITVALSGVGFLIGGIVQIDSTTLAGIILIALIMLALSFVPVAAGIAILRYRLYDIDIVISKTVVYAALAAFITGVYVAIVVGIGALVGVGDDPNAALSITATALVAVAFQPVRDRLQRFANRLVYGKRATPYEVMAAFGHRIAETPVADEVLADMAEAAARGIGATTARVTVFLPDARKRIVAWPEGAEADDQMLVFPVTHAGGDVGEVAVRKPQNEPLRPAERMLLEDLIAQAGLALHNVRLTSDLVAKVEELARKAEDIGRSRERLVTARDTQRRRLERELRAGVGAELGSIRDQLALDATRVRNEPRQVASSLEALGARARAALEELRDLARGIFPPLLVEDGLAAALEAHVRKAGVPAPAIDAAVRTGRFDPAAENAVYFCCVQAIQNARRHAAGAPVRVRLMADDARGTLSFVVHDDGPGFDPATVEAREGMQIMADRMAALGGELIVESAPGRGTSVTGRVPVRTAEAIAR